MTVSQNDRTRIAREALHAANIAPLEVYSADNTTTVVVTRSDVAAASHALASRGLAGTVRTGRGANRGRASVTVLAHLFDALPIETVGRIERPDPHADTWDADAAEGSRLLAPRTDWTGHVAYGRERYGQPTETVKRIERPDARTNRWDAPGDRGPFADLDVGEAARLAVARGAVQREHDEVLRAAGHGQLGPIAVPGPDVERLADALDRIDEAMPRVDGGVAYDLYRELATIRRVLGLPARITYPGGS